MHLQCVRLEEGKHALEASQPDTRSPRGNLPFCLFGAVKKKKKKKRKVKKKKTAWQVSVQVQAVKKEARTVMGSVLTGQLFHINTKHQLSIRHRQMKAIS